MYIKKSVISKIVMAIGMGILIVLTVLFCFTEVNVPGTVCMMAWIVCIVTVAELTDKLREDNHNKGKRHQNIGMM